MMLMNKGTYFIVEAAAVSRYLYSNSLFRVLFDTFEHVSKAALSQKFHCLIIAGECVLTEATEAVGFEW